MNNVSILIPSFRYRDCNKAVEWLSEAFGFKAHEVFKEESGKIVHAELVFGNSMIMIGPVADTTFGKHMITPDETPGRRVSHCVYVIVENPDAHYENAKRMGAEIIYPPTTKDYGGRDYGCRDFEGYLWSFGTYNPW